MNRMSAAVAALVWLAAGSNAQPSSSESTATKLVALSVVAVDERGQPVGDLTAEDFRITDAGKPQKVATFRYSDSRSRKVDSPGRGEFSNRKASNVPHATVILLDMFNEDADLQGSVGEFLARGLQSLESSEYLYLYLLTPEPRIYPVRGLPGPEGETPGTPASPWTRDVKSLMEQAMGKAYKVRPREIRIDERIRMTHSALERLGGMMGSVPGRKNIVWITHGVPVSLGSGFDTIDYEPWFRRLSAAYSRAGISVYPVQQAGTPNAGYIPLRSQDTLQLVAALTGGPKISDSIGSTVKQAMSDVRTSYLLGYFPAADNWDGKFHKVLVTCERKGVRLQTRAGYDASDAAAGSEQSTLDGALSAAFDASDIGIRGAVSAGKAEAGANGGRMTHFEFRIDPADVRMTRVGDRYTASLALQFAGFTNGKMERLRVVPFDIAVSSEDYGKVLKIGIPFSRDILLGDSVKAMRLVVFDRKAHAVGSLTMPLGGAARE